MQGIFLALLAVGCRPDEPAPPEDTKENEENDSVTVKGRSTVAGRVRAWSGVSGNETAHDTVETDANGNFTVGVPPEIQGLFLEAQNADGAVIYTSIVASSGPAGGTIETAPLDMETSLEAAVYVERLADQVGGGDVLDLRLRLDAATAGAVYATADDDTRVDALSAGIYAAQSTQELALTATGFDLTDSDWLDARAVAGLDYDARLLDGEDAQVALSMLVEDLIAIGVAEGGGTRALWQAEAQAGVAMRLTSDYRLVGLSPLESLSVQAGRIEAEYAVKAAMTAARSSGDGSLLMATRAATTGLLISAGQADELGEMQDAWEQFSIAFIGRVGQEGAIVGLLAGLGGAGPRAEVEIAIAAVAAAADDFEYQVGIVVEDAVAEGATGVEIAEIVTLMWASYVAEVQAAAAMLNGEPAEVAAAVELLVIATGGFRAVD